MSSWNMKDKKKTGTTTELYWWLCQVTHGWKLASWYRRIPQGKYMQIGHTSKRKNFLVLNQWTKDANDQSDVPNSQTTPSLPPHHTFSLANSQVINGQTENLNFTGRWRLNTAALVPHAIRATWGRWYIRYPNWLTQFGKTYVKQGKTEHA